MLDKVTGFQIWWRVIKNLIGVACCSNLLYYRFIFVTLRFRWIGHKESTHSISSMQFQKFILTPGHFLKLRHIHAKIRQTHITWSHYYVSHAMMTHTITHIHVTSASSSFFSCAERPDFVPIFLYRTQALRRRLVTWLWRLIQQHMAAR